GVPESVRRIFAECVPDIEKYPDPYCVELRSKLAEYEKLTAENIICGNGADDLIFRIVHAFRPGRALVCAPSFGEYNRAMEECGAEIVCHNLTEDNEFNVTESILTALDSSLDMCILSTPNNPTGRLIDPDILKTIAEKCEENDTLFVCDECFMGFVEDGENYSLMKRFRKNAIILKAFTKLFAMPGIRLGYAVCGDVSIAERIHETGQFWSVSSIAQKAGIAALEETDYLRRTVGYIAAEREYLTAELRSMGVRLFDPVANFIFFRSVDDLAERLLRNNILIRDCRNFVGLTAGYYRIAVRSHEENVRLIHAFRRCLNG
ncbi:MAG: aminotransferase class I/II-fold pyridoxal phosphate-dependent enzyme, partial [Ruminococcus sp.]|nr:aminotransferase class I/II-fold pyridoxal phosphate-dependent enzyme [Ruminococcus sp.]